MSNEQIIKEVCKEVFELENGNIEVVKRLMGGMSNFTYVISVNSKLYTFRIPGKRASKFVERVVESHHIELIEDLDLNNKTIYLDDYTGYKIAEYIEGTPLHELDPLDYLTEAAEVLHKIHDSGKKSQYNYNPLGRLALYENHLDEFDYVHSQRYVDLKQRFL